MIIHIDSMITMDYEWIMNGLWMDYEWIMNGLLFIDIHPHNQWIMNDHWISNGSPLVIHWSNGSLTGTWALRGWGHQRREGATKREGRHRERHREGQSHTVYVRIFDLYLYLSIYIHVCIYIYMHIIYIYIYYMQYWRYNDVHINHDNDGVNNNYRNQNNSNSNDNGDENKNVHNKSSNFETASLLPFTQSCYQIPRCRWLRRLGREIPMTSSILKQVSCRDLTGSAVAAVGCWKKRATNSPENQWFRFCLPVMLRMRRNQALIGDCWCASPALSGKVPLKNHLLRTTQNFTVNKSTICIRNQGEAVSSLTCSECHRIKHWDWCILVHLFFCWWQSTSKHTEKHAATLLCLRFGICQVQMTNEREVNPTHGDPLLRLVQRDGTFWVWRPAMSQWITCEQNWT